jgi:hypothetical protein
MISTTRNQRAGLIPHLLTSGFVPSLLMFISWVNWFPTRNKSGSLIVVTMIFYIHSSIPVGAHGLRSARVMHPPAGPALMLLLGRRWLLPTRRRGQIIMPAKWSKFETCEPCFSSSYTHEEWTNDAQSTLADRSVPLAICMLCFSSSHEWWCSWAFDSPNPISNCLREWEWHMRLVCMPWIRSRKKRKTKQAVLPVTKAL